MHATHRHKAHERGIAMDDGGLCVLDDVLKLPDFRGVSVEDVERIVQQCAKQRFRLVRGDDGRMRIGATQGHTIATIDPTSLMTPLTVAMATEFPIVVHGTNRRAWPSIVASGLSPMGRQHVHLATGYSQQAGVISGMRRSAEVIVHVDVGAGIAAGIPFFLSQNGVILTPGDATGYLPTRFFTRVVDAKTGRDIPFVVPAGSGGSSGGSGGRRMGQGSGGGGGAADAASGGARGGVAAATPADGTRSAGGGVDIGASNIGSGGLLGRGAGHRGGPAADADGPVVHAQPVDYLAVLDFEATCKEGDAPSPQVCMLLVSI
jgi:2'-phosphotransferase